MIVNNYVDNRAQRVKREKERVTYGGGIASSPNNLLLDATCPMANQDTGVKPRARLEPKEM
jgi:hypothetical protein